VSTASVMPMANCVHEFNRVICVGNVCVDVILTDLRERTRSPRETVGRKVGSIVYRAYVMARLTMAV